MTVPQRISWPHALLHELSAHGINIVTAGIYLKAHHFQGRKRLPVLHRGLLSVAVDFGWRLEAWAVFSNHYHFAGHSPDEGADNLSQMLGLLHEKTAKWINRLDAETGREVWHNFWETRLTHKRSYLARLNYVHQNPVKHVWSQWPTSIHGVRLPGLKKWHDLHKLRRFTVSRLIRLRFWSDYDVSAQW